MMMMMSWCHKVMHKHCHSSATDKAMHKVSMLSMKKFEAWFMISAEFCILHLAISCFSLLGSILAWRYSTTWLFQHDRQHLSSWCDMMWLWIMNIFCNIHKESKEIPTRSNEKLSPISSRFCRVSACRVNSLRRSKSKASLVLRCYFLDWYNKENV